MKQSLKIKRIYHDIGKDGATDADQGSNGDEERIIQHETWKCREPERGGKVEAFTLCYQSKSSKKTFKKRGPELQGEQLTNKHSGQ
jgi:hypothetical protein